MKAIELKFPPLFLLIIFAILMVSLDFIFPQASNNNQFYWQAAIISMLLGVGVAAAGAYTFRKAQTTVNPMKPETASRLVTSGIYKFSRNPMYLGCVLVLIGLFIFLNNQWLIAGPISFVLYMNLFQIAPEERAMQKLFGENYNTYCDKVRRWV